MLRILTSLIVTLPFLLADAPSSKLHCDAAPGFSEQAIFSELSKNYSATYRPRRDVLEPVLVTATLGIDTIFDFSGKANLLSLSGWIMLKWEDDFIKWKDKYPHNCIDEITVPSELLWIPDVKISNAPDGGGRNFLYPKDSRAIVYKDGSVEYQPTGLFEVKCRVLLKYYPFDEQVCFVRLISPNYDENQMNLTYEGIESNNRTYVLASEMFINDHPLWEIIDNFTTIDDNEPAVLFYLKLRRRPEYYYVNIVAPGFIISSVELIVFAAPLESVPKFAIAFTCLLAYTVFLSMSSIDNPKSSEWVSIIDLYIYLQMAYICIIIIGGQALIFFIIDLSKLRNSTPPKWLLRLACKKVEKVSPNTTPSSLSSQQLVGRDESKKIIEDDTDMFKPKKEAEVATNKDGDNKKKDDPKQWLAVAQLVNSISMVLYVLAIVLTPLVMFLAIPKKAKVPKMETD